MRWEHPVCPCQLLWASRLPSASLDGIYEGIPAWKVGSPWDGQKAAGAAPSLEVSKA